MSKLFEWLSSFALPKGTDLALWWIGVLGVAAIFKMSDPEKVILTLGGGLVGFLGGRMTTSENGVVQSGSKV